MKIEIDSEDVIIFILAFIASCSIVCGIDAIYEESAYGFIMVDMGILLVWLTSIFVARSNIVDIE